MGGLVEVLWGVIACNLQWKVSGTGPGTPEHYTGELGMSIAKTRRRPGGGPRRISTAPKVKWRTLNLREAYREFRLAPDQIYAAVDYGEVHAVWRRPRDRRSTQGQTEYPEWELKKLADDLGLTLLSLESPPANRCYQPPIRIAASLAA